MRRYQNIIILILLAFPFFGNSQIDSAKIWIDGDNYCMTKEKAIDFVKMKDSLFYFQMQLLETEVALENCLELYSSSKLLVEKLEMNRNFYIERIELLQEQIYIGEERIELRNKELSISRQELESSQKLIQDLRTKSTVQIIIGSALITGLVIAIITIAT